MLAGSLAERGDLDEAEQILRVRVDAGDGLAALDLADMLAERGDLDGAEQLLRARADAGDGFAVVWLARLLAGHGDLDEAEHILRPHGRRRRLGRRHGGRPSCWWKSATWTDCASAADAGDGFASRAAGRSAGGAR